MADETQPLPVGTLLDELIGDTSSDYADGDNPGYFRFAFDADTGVLQVHYEHNTSDGDEMDPDDEPEFGPASYRFQLVGDA